MREILFRAKALKDGKWVCGSLTTHRLKGYTFIEELTGNGHALHTVDEETVCQYTGLTDKNGAKIFEGDIVNYNNIYEYNCRSVVNIGKYDQDGSGGEYDSHECFGAYVKVDNFTCLYPNDNDDPFLFPYYLKTQNLMEINVDCEIIGNIYDNPELLEVSE